MKRPEEPKRTSCGGIRSIRRTRSPLTIGLSSGVPTWIRRVTTLWQCVRMATTIYTRFTKNLFADGWRSSSGGSHFPHGLRFVSHAYLEEARLEGKRTRQVAQRRFARIPGNGLELRLPNTISPTEIMYIRMRWTFKWPPLYFYRFC